jgi:hypothetical protein
MPDRSQIGLNQLALLTGLLHGTNPIAHWVFDFLLSQETASSSGPSGRSRKRTAKNAHIVDLIGSRTC